MSTGNFLSTFMWTLLNLRWGDTYTTELNRVIHHCLFFKKKADAEQNYSANDRELLGLIRFLQNFRCYLECAEFEIITDNQVLNYRLRKRELSERSGMGTAAGIFGIFPLHSRNDVYMF